MDYINLLSDSDKDELCKIISGRRLKKLFRKKSNDFSRIFRGFRSDSLTEDQALSIGIANIDAPFIHTYINQKVEYWLSEVQKSVQNSISIGISEEKAILTALLDSAFHGKPSFYFLFSQSDKDSSYIRTIESALEVIQTPQESSKCHSEEMISKKAHATEKMEWVTKNAGLQKELDTLRSENHELESALNSEKAKNTTLLEDNQSMSDELDDYRTRAARVGSVSTCTRQDGFPYSSICSVYRDYEGRVRLKRIADIGNNEILDSLCDDYPAYENLFAKDGPDSDDFVGTWDWKTSPRESDPSRDYIFSSYNEACSPIEVCTLHNCTSANDILKNLIDGIDCCIRSEKVFFCIWDSLSSRYTGIICTQNELQSVNEKYILKESIITVPVFEFSFSDTLQKQNLTFLRCLNPGIPKALLLVKDELEYVRDIILQQASWSAFKQKGLQHSDQRMVKDFLAELPVAQLTQEISNKCGCNSAHAKDLLKEFKARAEEYLDGTDIASDLLAEIAQNHTELFSACTESLRSQWYSENAQAVADAQAELERIHQETASLTLKYEDLQRQYSTVKKEYEEIIAKLSEREKLAQEVERKVSEKIDAAKKNAADFIAEQAFCHSATSIFTSNPAENSHWIPPHLLDKDNMEESKSWKVSLEIMESELEEAGVAPQHVRNLAAFLTACSCNRTVPLLAGPYGHDIADACSAALYGTSSTVIPNPDHITTEDLQTLAQCKDSVIILENPFCPGAFRCVDWLRNCFVIAINPFAEDLQIEPAEFANYYLPVMTELLVDNVPSRHFLGSVPSPNYMPYTPCNSKRLHSSLLNKLKLSALSQKRLQQTLSDFHNILGSDDCSQDFLFSLLPLSYTLRKMDVLFESSIKDSCSKDMQELLDRYWSDSQ